MDVTIVDGNNRITRDLPQAPEIGDTVRIKLPGAPDRDLTVRGRRWIFAIGGPSGVELDCI